MGGCQTEGLGDTGPWQGGSEGGTHRLGLLLRPKLEFLLGGGLELGHMLHAQTGVWGGLRVYVFVHACAGRGRLAYFLPHASLKPPHFHLETRDFLCQVRHNMRHPNLEGRRLQRGGSVWL